MHEVGDSFSRAGHTDLEIHWSLVPSAFYMLRELYSGSKLKHLTLRDAQGYFQTLIPSLTSMNRSRISLMLSFLSEIKFVAARFAEMTSSINAEMCPVQ